MKKFTALAMALVLALTAVFVATPNEKASALTVGTTTGRVEHGTCPSCTKSGYTLTVEIQSYFRGYDTTICWNPFHDSDCVVFHEYWHYSTNSHCSNCNYSDKSSWYADESRHAIYHPDPGAYPNVGPIRG